MPSAILSCKHTSSKYKIRSDIILSIPIASLVPFPLLNPNWPLPSTCIWRYSTCISTRQQLLSTTVLTVAGVICTSFSGNSFEDDGESLWDSMIRGVKYKIVPCGNKVLLNMPLVFWNMCAFIWPCGDKLEIKVGPCCQSPSQFISHFLCPPLLACEVSEKYKRSELWKWNWKPLIL